MDHRRLGLPIITLAALALAACSSSTSGSGGAQTTGGTAATSKPASSPASSAPSSASAPSASATAANDPEALAAFMQQGLASTRSAHIHLLITTAGKTITGDGDEKIAAGKLSALSLTETIPGAGRLKLVLTGGKTYAELPGRPTTAGKPWVLVTPSSTDPQIKSLAASLSSSQSSASIGNAGVFAKAAGSIKNLGTTTVGSSKATHYYVIVETAKLDSDYPGRSALVQAGVRTLPVDLYVDSQGRPVRVTDKLTVSGNTVASEFTVTDYNRPVTISAPPAGQVTTG